MDNIEDQFVSGDWLPPKEALPKANVTTTTTPKKRKRKQKSKETSQKATSPQEKSDKKRKKEAGNLQLRVTKNYIIVI